MPRNEETEVIRDTSWRLSRRQVLRWGLRAVSAGSVATALVRCAPGESSPTEAVVTRQSTAPPAGLGTATGIASQSANPSRTTGEQTPTISPRPSVAPSVTTKSTASLVQIPFPKLTVAGLRADLQKAFAGAVLVVGTVETLASELNLWGDRTVANPGQSAFALVVAFHQQLMTSPFETEVTILSPDPAIKVSPAPGTREPSLLPVRSNGDLLAYRSVAVLSNDLPDGANEIVCALTFGSNRVVVVGQRLGLSPRRNELGVVDVLEYPAPPQITPTPRTLGAPQSIEGLGLLF